MVSGLLWTLVLGCPPWRHFVHFIQILMVRKIKRQKHRLPWFIKCLQDKHSLKCSTYSFGFLHSPRSWPQYLLLSCQLTKSIEEYCNIFSNIFGCFRQKDRSGYLAYYIAKHRSMVGCFFVFCFFSFYEISYLFPPAILEIYTCIISISEVR